MTTAQIRNAMTIDVEDYFQVSAFAPHILREHWDSLPCRVERNIDIALALLHEGRAHATFFTLGWIAERYPAVVRRIVDNGHELASHGYGHHRVSDQNRNDFGKDIAHAKKLLEDISFDAGSVTGEYVINAEAVTTRLAALASREDLARYVL
mgnify:CR=1 FL=1